MAPGSDSTHILKHWDADGAVKNSIKRKKDWKEGTVNPLARGLSLKARFSFIQGNVQGLQLTIHAVLMRQSFWTRIIADFSGDFNTLVNWKGMFFFKKGKGRIIIEASWPWGGAWTGAKRITAPQHCPTHSISINLTIFALRTLSREQRRTAHRQMQNPFNRRSKRKEWTLNIVPFVRTLLYNCLPQEIMMSSVYIFSLSLTIPLIFKLFA